MIGRPNTYVRRVLLRSSARRNLFFIKNMTRFSTFLIQKLLPSLFFLLFRVQARTMSGRFGRLPPRKRRSRSAEKPDFHRNRRRIHSSRSRSPRSRHPPERRRSISPPPRHLQRARSRSPPPRWRAWRSRSRSPRRRPRSPPRHPHCSPNAFSQRRWSISPPPRRRWSPPRDRAVRPGAGAGAGAAGPGRYRGAAVSGFGDWSRILQEVERHHQIKVG